MNFSDRILLLEERIELQDKLIEEFSCDCKRQAYPIIDKICSRVIISVNNKLEDGIFSDDMPARFNNIDAITVLYCHYSYTIQEINPHLEEFILNEIEKEFSKLQYIEKIMLWYMDCDINGEIDLENIYYTIYTRFLVMIDKHYETKKIHSYCERL